METSFRKIDIDKYDEEVLNDEDLYDADPRDPSQVLEEARQRQAAVRSSLAKYVSSRVKVPISHPLAFKSYTILLIRVLTFFRKPFS